MGQNSLQVWRLRLDASAISAGQIGQWRGWLSGEELRRADSFHGEEHRVDYIAAHAALRFVLGRSLSIGPALVRFVREDGALAAGGGGSRTKPTLDPMSQAGGRSGFIDLGFNLSHTRGAALIGIAQGREVGVDIEWHRPMEDLESMAAAVMSKEELGSWEALAPGQRLNAFYHLWTRKESYLKAIGLGLFRDLHEVTVPVSAEALAFVSGMDYEARDVRDRSGEVAGGAGVWRVTDVPVWRGYSASVCFQGPESSLIEVMDLDLGELLA